MSSLRLMLLCALVCITTACSSLIYRLPITQGNFLEQKDVDKLRAGMTREQVLYVLGNPVARSSFADDRWEYLFSVRDGSEETTRKRVTLYFVDDKLNRLDGDLKTPEKFKDIGT